MSKKTKIWSVGDGISIVYIEDTSTKIETLIMSELE